MKWSKIVRAGVAGGLLVLAGIFALFRYAADAPSDTKDGKKPAGTVNGEPFFKEDLDLYALELRAAVSADYGRRYGLSGMGEQFWDTKYGNTTPRQTLHTMALNQLIRNMVLIQEARRRGIDAPARYGDLADERENWNAQGDEIVYGPKKYGPMEYLSSRLTGITGALKTALLKNELSPTENQLRGIFAGLPEGLKRAPWQASGVVFKWNDPAAAIYAALERFLRQGLSPLEAARALPGISQEDFELYSNYISKEDPYQRELAQILENAAPGDCVPGPQGLPELYYVTGKTGGGLLSFEEAPGLAVNQWINDQFELFLDQKVKAAKVKVFAKNN
jgi:hypothetical protein